MIKIKNITKLQDFEFYIVNTTGELSKEKVKECKITEDTIEIKVGDIVIPLGQLEKFSDGFVVFADCIYQEDEQECTFNNYVFTNFNNAKDFSKKINKRSRFIYNSIYEEL